MPRKPADAMKRRTRSKFTKQDALDCMEWYAKRVYRFCETSDASSFTHPNSRGKKAMGYGSGYINVQLMIPGSFGAADDLFEAIRVLAGYHLPRKG